MDDSAAQLQDKDSESENADDNCLVMPWSNMVPSQFTLQRETPLPDVDSSTLESIFCPENPNQTVHCGIIDTSVPNLRTPSVSPSLNATPRAGISPSALSDLSMQIHNAKKQGPSPGINPVISQTARRRMNLDRLLNDDSLKSSNSSDETIALMEFFSKIDDREAERTHAWRIEQQRRDDDREKREREYQREREQERAARAQREAIQTQILAALAAKLMGDTFPAS